MASRRSSGRRPRRDRRPPPSPLDEPTDLFADPEPAAPEAPAAGEFIPPGPEDDFLDEPMTKSLKERERRSKKILKLDEAVSDVVVKLKAKGLTSPYLRSFVVARVNYTRFSKATSFDFDETLDKIIASAQKFNVDRVNLQDVAKAGGGGPADED